MKWIRLYKSPIGTESQIISIRYNGIADALIFLEGRWHWYDRTQDTYRAGKGVYAKVQDFIWENIEVLDETEQASPDGWVAVEKGLPPKYAHVLACTNKGNIKITCIDNDNAFDEYELDGSGEYYTDWHYLPKLPTT